MIVETMLLSLLVGKLRSGKIKNLDSLYIKGWYVFVLSLLIEIISLLIVSRTYGNASNIIESYFHYIHILIYLLFIIGLAINWNSIGFRITLFGSILNFLPIAFNEGKMPVSPNALIYSRLYTQLSLLEEGRIMTHSLLNQATKFPYLSDIIPIPEPYIFPKIISVGDILISLGLFLLIQLHMKDNKQE